MFKSIFSRLVWTFTIVLTFVFILMLPLMSGLYLQSIANNKFNSAVQASKNIEYMTALMVEEGQNPHFQHMYHSTVSSWSNIVGSDITVLNSDGDVYYSTNNIKIIPPEIIKSVNSDTPYKKYIKFGDYYTGKVYCVGLPIKYNNRIIGSAIYNTPINNFASLWKEFLTRFLISSLLSILVSYIIIYHQAIKISKPISAINSAVLDIASGKLEKRLPVSSKDEIGQLSSAFNYMADSLEKSDKLRQSFISDISHELRTPMTSISGFVEGILDGTIPPEKQNEYLKIVLEESNRLSKMASDMFEMSKMSTPEYKLDMKEFNICELVRIAIISLESKFDNKHLELDVDFSKDKINVIADHDSILRVIINLLDNAVKFSYDNTKIKVAVWTDSNKCYVRVGNFGIGIDSADLEHIFDRFYKTDKSRSRDKSGAGLGLSMAKNIMKLHNGRIWAESINAKEGSDIKFTTFTFSLELA